MIHQPVMLERCITLLTPSIDRSSNPVVVDATLGLGGHTEALLARFPNLRIVAKEILIAKFVQTVLGVNIVMKMVKHAEFVSKILKSINYENLVKYY